MSFLSTVVSTIPASHSVTYSCTMNNNWSAENHPINYPGNDAHWSPPVVVAHTRKYNMWQAGELATKGVESVAETGTTFRLRQEFAKENDKVGEFVEGDDMYNTDTQSQTFQDIALTPWFDKMSSITMVAPSPDWFTGFDSVSPIDQDSNVWYQSFTVATAPWDAGTEKGDTFSLSNPSENPRLPIMEFTKDTVPPNGVLLSPDGTEVLPMATWTCTLMTNSCVDHNNVMFKNNAKKDCNWAGKPKNRKNRDRRCNKRYLGRRIHDYCPNACGMCLPEIPL